MTLFHDSSAFSGFSTNDLERAQRFYRDTLGLDAEVRDGMLHLHLAGRDVIVYPKPDHRPATYTVLNFPVASVDEAVRELTAAGVKMARYDGLPQDANGVMRGHGPTIAWFEDPGGNVLSVIEASPSE